MSTFTNEGKESRPGCHKNFINLSLKIILLISYQTIALWNIRFVLNIYSSKIYIFICSLCMCWFSFIFFSCSVKRRQDGSVWGLGPPQLCVCVNVCVWMCVGGSCHISKTKAQSHSILFVHFGLQNSPKHRRRNGKSFQTQKGFWGLCYLGWRSNTGSYI